MKATVALSDLAFKVLDQAYTLATAFDNRVIIPHVVVKDPAGLDGGLGSAVISTMYHLLVSTVSHDVLQRAHCPVLAVPGRKDAQPKG